MSTDQAASISTRTKPTIEYENNMLMERTLLDQDSSVDQVMGLESKSKISQALRKNSLDSGHEQNYVDSAAFHSNANRTCGLPNVGQLNSGTLHPPRYSVPDRQDSKMT